MNKKLIIIEGTDNVGKDTVINQLLNTYKNELNISSIDIINYALNIDPPLCSIISVKF